MLQQYHNKLNVQSHGCSTDDKDDGEVCTQFSQMNLTIWLKLWKREKEPSFEVWNKSQQDITQQSI
jgi:hypothetical protein